jgi:hypothetical protein
MRNSDGGGTISVANTGNGASSTDTIVIVIMTATMIAAERFYRTGRKTAPPLKAGPFAFGVG